MPPAHETNGRLEGPVNRPLRQAAHSQVHRGTGFEEAPDITRAGDDAKRSGRARSGAVGPPATARVASDERGVAAC